NQHSLVEIGRKRRHRNLLQPLSEDLFIPRSDGGNRRLQTLRHLQPPASRRSKARGTALARRSGASAPCRPESGARRRSPRTPCPPAPAERAPRAAWGSAGPAAPPPAGGGPVGPHRPAAREPRRANGSRGSTAPGAG